MSNIKDANEITIKIDDLLLYGYGFYSRPVVGKVIALYKKHVRIKFVGINECVIETVCKKPEYSLVVNHFKDDPKTVELFGLNHLGA